MQSIHISGQLDALVMGVRRGQFKRLSSDFYRFGSRSVTLWLTSGDGFRLTSQMHDLANRTEAGILCIEQLVQADPKETSVDLPWQFKKGGSASKLIVRESGWQLESGLLFESPDGDEVSILPAAFPSYLCVQGIETPPQEVTSEYPLARYTRLLL